MSIAIFLLEHETNMRKYTLASIKSLFKNRKKYILKPPEAKKDINLESLGDCKYVIFSISNDDEKKYSEISLTGDLSSVFSTSKVPINISISGEFINVYYYSPSLVSVHNQYSILHNLLDKYQKDTNTKFDNILITKANSLFALENFSLTDNKYLSTISNLKEVIKETSYSIPSYTYIDSIQLHSELYYSLDNKVLSIKDHPIPQKYLASVYTNVFLYNCITSASGGFNYIPADSINQAIKDKIIFFIPNVVHVTSHGSNWTANERLEQTINTVKSVRKKVPQSVIFVLEGSALPINEMEKLSSVSDYLILFNDEKFTSIVNNYNKSKFEMHSIMYMLDNLQGYKWFVKFGGRYALNGRFDNTKFFSNAPTFFYNKHMYSYNYSQPILYSIPVEYTQKYINHLKEMDLPFHNIEYILYCFCYRSGIECNFINDNEKLWATGYSAASYKLTDS